MALAELTRESVFAAMGEYDQLGREAFLRLYGFGPARDYFLLHNGQRYDSKAIAGAAHKFAVPTMGALRPSDFSGGEATVARTFTRLGFDDAFRLVASVAGPYLRSGLCLGRTCCGIHIRWVPGPSTMRIDGTATVR